MTILKSICIPALLIVGLSSSAWGASKERVEAVIQGVNYVGVSVSDLERSVNIYDSSAQLQLISSGVIENSTALNELAGRTVRANTVLARSSNTQLRFMQFHDSSSQAKSASPIPVQGPGIAHVCFQVAKTTNTYQRFLEAGATSIGDSEMVQLNAANPVDYAYIHDTDKLILEIEHIDFDKVSAPRKNDYRIRHVSLATPNMQRMVDFYSVLMEEPQPRRVGIGGTLQGENFDRVSGYAGTKLEMAWFQVRNLELELIQYHSHPSPLPTEPRPVDALGFNMVVFDVLSLEAARNKLLAAGGTIVSESQKLDDAEILFGRDPDGNLLGFQVLNPSSLLSAKNFADDGV